MLNIIVSKSVILSWGLATFGTIFVGTDCPARETDVTSVAPSSFRFSTRGSHRNGTPTELWAYPFLVSLIEHHHFHTNTSRHWCGGVLVTLKVAMTSCGCVGVVELKETVVHERCNRLMVLAGTPDVYLKDSIHKQLRPVFKCELHPGCNLEKKVTADVGLIILKKEFKLTTHTKPMKLYSMDRETLVSKLEELTVLGSVCHQPGWDEVSINYGVKPRTPGWISEGKGQLINRDKCSEMHCLFEDKGPVCDHPFPQGDFCSTTYQGMAPNLAETGGPLICHGFVLGITSIPSCNPCSPSVYVGPELWHGFIIKYIDHEKPTNAGLFGRQLSLTMMAMWTFGIQCMNL